MIECPNCHTMLEDGSRFCGNCGSVIPEPKPEPEETPEPAAPAEAPAFSTVLCPSCGEENSTEFMFCQRCGARLTGEPDEEKKPKAKRGGAHKLTLSKPLKLGAIALVAVVVVVGLILLFGGKGGGGQKRSGAFYFKDGDICYSAATAKTPVQITSRLTSKNSDGSYPRNTYYMDYTYLCKDGKTLIYPDRYDSDNSVFTLYFRNIGNMKKDAVKIDSGMSYFAVNESENTVTYRKNDGTLCQYSMKKQERDKIANNARDYRVTKDGKIVAYTDDDGTLYLKQTGKDKEKLASGVDRLNWLSADGRTVIYTKDSNVYRQTVGKEREKLVSDLGSSGILRITTDGAFYYSKELDEDRTILDYVRDDKTLSDRDKEYLEDNLKNQRLSNYFAELYYYDGKASTLVTDLWYRSGVSSFAYTSRALGCIQTLDEENYDPVKYSDFSSYFWDGISKLEKAFEEHLNSVVVDGEKLRSVELEDLESVLFSSDGSRIFFLSDYSEKKDEADLYRAELSGSGELKTELVDQEVSMAATRAVVFEKSILYFKDCNTAQSSGELYLDGKLIDDEAYLNYYRANSKNKTLIYFSEREKNGGTLKQYSGGKSARISDDVYNAEYAPDGSILYLSDYSSSKYRGDLYQFRGNKAVKIDEDVTRIIRIRTA